MRRAAEADPLRVAVGGLLVIALAVAASLSFGQLPIVGGATTYQAQLPEAGGLRAEDPVRIAGIRAGRVEDVELAQDRVLVTFRVDDAWIGDRTTAAVEIATLFGAKYLALEPSGSRPQDPKVPIPLERTRSLFDAPDAINGLSATVGAIETEQLARSFETLADTFRGTPDEARAALDGLSRLSRTIASRDRQLARLLDGAENVTGVLADRNREFEKLLADGNRLLEELGRRREAVGALLDNTRRLSTELRGLVAENREQLRPALEQLDRVTAMLQRNQDSLDRGIEQLAPFARLINNAVSHGRWVDHFLCNLVPPREGPINREGCYARGN